MRRRGRRYRPGVRQGRRQLQNRELQNSGTSESLPDREEKLEVTDGLRYRRAEGRQRAGRQIRVALNQLRHGAMKANERRWIDAVGQIDAKRPDGRAVPDSKPGGVDHVIEILKISLCGPKRHIAKGRINVSHVVENDAPDVFAQQRKAQLRAVEEERVAAEREPGGLG